MDYAESVFGRLSGTRDSKKFIQVKNENGREPVSLSVVKTIKSLVL